MNTKSRDTDESARLQHAAEHTSPKKSHSVFIYLAILAAVAFLLLLMAYLMQLRTNQVALDTLQQTSNSAVGSLENLINERDHLQDQVQGLESRIAALEEKNQALTGQLQDAQSQSGQSAQLLEQAANEREALCYLNELRILYNKGRYKEARELIARIDSPLTPQPYLQTACLTAISAGMSEEARAIYDPLEAYNSLKGWLGAD